MITIPKCYDVQPQPERCTRRQSYQHPTPPPQFSSLAIVHHPNCSQCNSTLARPTVIHPAAVLRTLHISPPDPQAAIRTLSSFPALATTSLINASTSGLPCKISSDVEESQSVPRCAEGCFSRSLEKARDRRSPCFVLDLEMGEIFSNCSADGFSPKGEIREDGDCVQLGRVECRAMVTRGEAWSSMSSLLSQDRASVRKLKRGDV
jgi:hypothetical protein